MTRERSHGKRKLHFTLNFGQSLVDHAIRDRPGQRFGSIPIPHPHRNSMNRIFLISPARAAGRRAQFLGRPGADFELARQLQIGDATLGEVFTFCSGLYFRAKLAYARRFAQPPPGLSGVHIITPSRGLVTPGTRIGNREMVEFGSVEVAADEPRFTGPLQTSARRLVAEDCEVVLLGSVATGKYIEPLLPIFGPRLLFPGDFVGRGDMSRGGLLLRCVRLGAELEYLPIAGAVRNGPRAPRISARQ
jgi:hypothetical protein